MFVEKINDLGFTYLFINKHLLSTTLDARDTKRNHNHKILTNGGERQRQYCMISVMTWMRLTFSQHSLLKGVNGKYFLVSLELKINPKC